LHSQQLQPPSELVMPKGIGALPNEPAFPR
jgi:hypothetical protein